MAAEELQFRPDCPQKLPHHHVLSDALSQSCIRPLAPDLPHTARLLPRVANPSPPGTPPALSTPR
ncbi:hypothetical protein IQ07DRAFT_406664 [Pyrenochaeta sp. DS3sAY3a]|nr:hypothetical protein IQ07DRAFT_406664 [Pyrenochaeta sp. DS3sAY3a]